MKSTVDTAFPDVQVRFLKVKSEYGKPNYNPTESGYKSLDLVFSKGSILNIFPDLSENSSTIAMESLGKLINLGNFFFI